MTERFFGQDRRDWRRNVSFYQDEISSPLQEKLNEEKERLTDIRSEMDARLREVEKLEIGNEYRRGAIESFVEVNVGDNLYQKLGGAEVVVKDGVVVEFREREDIQEAGDLSEELIEPE